MAGKRGDVFQGVGALQLKFEIFNETKAYKRKTCLYEMFFSVLKFDRGGGRGKRGLGGGGGGGGGGGEGG